MKELEFIQYLANKFKAKKPVIEGIGDDCAVLEHTKNKYMLLTCDMLIEDTHFTKKAKPFEGVTRQPVSELCVAEAKEQEEETMREPPPRIERAKVGHYPQFALMPQRPECAL